LTPESVAVAPELFIQKSLVYYPNKIGKGARRRKEVRRR
jgi:hypothetical protein